MKMFCEDWLVSGQKLGGLRGKIGGLRSKIGEVEGQVRLTYGRLNLGGSCGFMSTQTKAKSFFLFFVFGNPVSFYLMIKYLLI